MKKLAFAALAAMMCLGFAGSGIAQEKMGDHKMEGHKKTGKKHPNKMRDVAMAGLTADEMKIAHGMKMSKAEHAVMHKRMGMCMADKHKGMDMSKMDDKAGMAHMMSGMKKSEQKTMMGAMSKMTPEQMAVCKKMMGNCCMYGMKHGK